MFWQRPRRGFTLVEVMIATTLFALLMVGVIGIFRSGSQSFNAGTWRLTTQKRAQLFLTRWKEVVEKANNAEVLPASGDPPPPISRPIFIRNSWLNQGNPASNTEIMVFSISQPFIEANPDINITQPIPGSWTCVVLTCKDRTLTLFRSGDINDLPPSAPSQAGSPDLVQFPSGFTGGDFRIDLPDVSSMAFILDRATGDATVATSTTLTLKLDLVRYSNGSPTSAKLTESMTANLIHRDHEVQSW